MKKYNVPNYVRYKKDVIACQPDEEIALEDPKITNLAMTTPYTVKYRKAEQRNDKYI